MRAGDRIGRFVVEREAGAGGMGRVYRAVDRDGAPVAVKVLHRVEGEGAARFAREVEVLSRLRDPGIVGYLDHGTTDDDAPFLAMEWLDGDPLSRVLARGPLGIEDALALVAAVASGLGAAHAAGIVHRDVKPANLLLLGGDPRRPKVLDFGVARRAEETRSLTRTGMVVGSFFYMSPEQALGGQAVTPASDVFALGCVLYECLAGRRAFHAADATAVLAKILLDDPIPLRELRPEIPAAVERLVLRMLRKRAEERLADGRAVAEEIARLDPDAAPPSLPAGARGLGSDEQRVVWLALASEVVDVALTQSEPGVPDPERARAESLVAAAAREGGDLAFLVDGSALVTFRGASVATDAASRAARCALAIRDTVSDRPVVLAMGLGIVQETGTPMGAVIDRAALALRGAPTRGVRLVDVPEDLLAPAFEIQRDEHGARLVAAREAAHGTRLLLGRQTDCVGRDREIAVLASLQAETSSERTARVALVTGDAGVGKSRVRHELLRRLAESDAPPTVLVGRGDIVGAGSPFSLLSEAVRNAAGGAPLSEHVAGLLPGEDVERVTAFLSELCGAPLAEGVHPPLDIARRDARATGDAMRAAFEDWLAAQCARAPVVLVLEDLHWGDVPTVRFVDAALRNLGDRPLFVLALGRPDTLARFPNLWKDHDLLHLSLGPLPKRAQERLIVGALGARATSEVVRGIIARCEGNAFFLEELIRSVAAAGDVTVALPESVVGVVQARLDALGPDARRALRAASVYGARFSRGGLEALLAGAASPSAAIAELERHELIARVLEEAPSDDDAWVFRNALVRETAYAMLTDDDRRLGHELAGAWLEAHGEPDAIALVEHFERGLRPERAARWLARATAQALGGNDLAEGIALAQRALRVATDPEQIAELSWLEAEAHRWRGEFELGIACAARAVELARPGTVRFYLALGEAIASSAFSGDFAGATPHFRRALDTPPEPDARSARVVSLTRGSTQLLEAGRYDEVDAIIAAIAKDGGAALDTHARGWVHWLHAMRALCAGDLGRFVDATERALECFDTLAEERNVCSHRTNLGYAYAELGDYARAEIALRHVLADARRLGLPLIVAYAEHNLGNVLASLGRPEEGLVEEVRAAEGAAALKDPRLEGAARSYVAKMALAAGDVERAARETETAIAMLAEHPALLALAHAIHGSARLAAGATSDALLHTRRAIELLDAHGAFEDGETTVRLARVRALLAAGDDSGACAAAGAARARLLARADRIEDPRWRATFLESVAESRETLAIAARCGL